MDTLALRLHPQQDLKTELDKIAIAQGLEAACILACVGSLNRAALRLAGQPEATLWEGKFEIVSLTGTLSKDGSHYHIAIADTTGRTIGGHLVTGCSIYTTAEIVIGVLPGLRFQRHMDAATGYRELVITQPLAPHSKLSCLGNQQ